jgi:hypothetical protein
MSTSGVLVDRPVVDELAGACDLLAEADASSVWRLADGDVERGVSLLVRLQAHTAALQAVLLAEVESRDLKASTGAPSTERWLGDRWRLSRAGARLRQATALGRHPVLLDALTASAVTVEQAEVLAAVLHRIDALPDLDAGSDDGEAGGEGEAGAAAEFMVEQAALLSPPELERAGQAVVEALTRSPSVDDPADDAAEAREHERAERELQDQERNWLRVIHRPGGRVRVGTELGPVGAAGFLAWCRRIEKPAPGVDGFEDTRSPAERRGDALADLFTTDSPPDRPGGKLGGETAAADQTDLRDPDLLELAIDAAVDDLLADDLLADDRVEDELDADQAGPDLADDADSSVSSEVEMPVLPGQCGAVLNVITSLDQLRAGIPGIGHLDTGAPLSVAAVRQLACEAQVVPIVMNGASQVLDLGRASRPFNRAQRRAAAIRDRGCVAPGCDAPPADCHLHHSWWWSRGGPTDLDNAALLCSFHHRMVHRQDWAITLAANGCPQLHPPPHVDPTGRPRQHHRFTISDALHHRPRLSMSGRDQHLRT